MGTIADSVQRMSLRQLLAGHGVTEADWNAANSTAGGGSLEARQKIWNIFQQATGGGVGSEGPLERYSMPAAGGGGDNGGGGPTEGYGRAGQTLNMNQNFPNASLLDESLFGEGYSPVVYGTENGFLSDRGDYNYAIPDLGAVEFDPRFGLLNNQSRIPGSRVDRSFNNFNTTAQALIAAMGAGAGYQVATGNTIGAGASAAGSVGTPIDGGLTFQPGPSINATGAFAGPGTGYTGGAASSAIGSPITDALTVNPGPSINPTGAFAGPGTGYVPPTGLPGGSLTNQAIRAGVTGLTGTATGSGGGGSSSASTAAQPTITPEQQQLLNSLIARLGGSNSATTPYTAPLVAGMTPGQRTSLEALEQAALGNSQNPNFAQANRTVSEAQTAGPEDFTDYFNKSVQDPALKDFREKILPDVTRRFRGSAGFGSDRMAADRQATDDLTGSLAGQRAKLAYESRESAANRRLQAAGMVPGLQGGETSALVAALNAGGVAQGTEQNRLTANYQEFQRQNAGESQRIQEILAALGVRPFENITTVQQNAPSAGRSFLNGVLPGATNAALSYFLGR